MACRYDGPDDSASMCQQLDSVTRMLCGILDQVESAEDPVKLEDLPAETQQWWREHKAADAERNAEVARQERAAKQHEDLRQRGLMKLTPEERKALGLR